MVDIFWVRRMDAITGGAVVLTVDAVVFLMTALIGAPLLLFLAADEDGTVSALWPIVIVWVVSAVLGSAAAAATFLIGSRATPRVRQAGVATALATAVATGGLVATSVSSSPVLAMVSALFAAANLAAAKMLFTSEPAAALPESFRPAGLPEAFLLAAPLAQAEIRTRDTIEIQVRRPAEPGRVTEAPARPRRPRGPAAMRTMSGVRLPRRATRAPGSRTDRSPAGRRG